MTVPIAIVLGLLLVAIGLFAWEKLSVDIITLLLLIALVCSRILTPAEAYAGFSSDIIIILGSIFVISGALQETGVLDAVGGWILRLAGNSANRLLLMVMSVACGISAFMNNTTVTAMLLGPVIGAAKRSRVSPSKLLMPLAYASVLGGTCTLIGTSTNVAVSGYIQKAGLPPIGLFEITPVGLVIVAIGIIYMMSLGKRMLPDHRDAELTSDYEIREYLSEIIVMPNSPLIGQHTHESDLTIMDFTILKVIRGPEEFQPTSRVIIEEGDTLLVEGKVENLMKVKKIEGIEMKAEVKLGDLALKGVNFGIIEVLITPQSDLIGATLKQSNFRQRYGLTALAIYRHGRSLLEMIGDITIRVGDLLLLQGAQERIESLRRDQGIAILDEHEAPVLRNVEGFLTIGFFITAIVAGGLGWLPLSICFLAAALLTILLRCITIEKAYEFIDWRLLILIGGMTAFGTAMDNSHAAEFLADGIVHWLEPFGVMAILTGFFILTIILTQPMSNAAAALVVLPIAMSTATKLGASPRTFAIAIMLAASISFIAPFEPACILVYGPGKYRFMDFVKTGIGLTALLAIAVLMLIPVFWSLRAQ